MAVLVDQSGGGPRSVGTMLAVLGTGDSAGSMSSGCVEAAIVAEALDVIAYGKPRDVRFGEGSRYVDIRLPCGAAMDIRFLVDPDPSVIEEAVARLERRTAVDLRFSKEGTLSLTTIGTAEDDGLFVARYSPELRLIVAGHGPETLALLRLAKSHGADLHLLTPDEAIADVATREGVPATLLTSIAATPALDADRSTAIVLLFHDHDWEPALLDEALATSAFWIGAMGSARTARNRRAGLAARGHPQAAIDRLHGPIGSIASTRDPATLALSALADIVGHLPPSTT